MVDETQTIAESRALMAALTVVESSKKLEGVPPEVLIFNEKFSKEGTVEGAVIETALWVICGRAAGFSAPKITIRGRSAEEELFQSLADNWITWILQSERQQKFPYLWKEVDLQSPSVLHKMGLREWQFALEALHTNDTDTARKRFRRALKIGSEYGTPSNPAIHWSYAATFFSASQC